jgi:hypothetical protein
MDQQYTGVSFKVGAVCSMCNDCRYYVAGRKNKADKIFDVSTQNVVNIVLCLSVIVC